MALVTLTVLPSGRSTASPDTGDATGIASTDTYQFANDTNWKVLGPFPPAIYNDASGFCSFTTSAAGDAVAVRSS